MAASLVLLIGEDICHRSEVLRSAGYAVEECASEITAAAWFRGGRSADIVCITEGTRGPAEAPLAIARHFSSAPMVLFRSANHNYLQRVWDLDVPLYRPPELWLEDIAALLASMRTTIACSAELRVDSRNLQGETARLPEESRRLREELSRVLSRGTGQRE